MSKVKLGIIGLGRLGMRHASNIHQRVDFAELTAVCSVMQEELDRAVEAFHPKYSTTDYQELLEDKNLDGIVIASNSAFHASMAIDALKAGVKNIYLEKPIGMTKQEIDDLKEAIDRYGVNIFQPGYNRRFDASYREMRDQVTSGKIGKPILVRFVNRDPVWDTDNLLRFSPTSGGLVLDMLTHDYDLSRWILGSDAKSVYGIGENYGYEGLDEIGDIDNCMIAVEYENGVMGVFEASRNSVAGFDCETEVYGTEGSVRMGFPPSKNRVISFTPDGLRIECADDFYDYFEPSFPAEIQHFAECIRDNKKPIVNFEDGYKAVEWALLATNAVRNNEKLVFN